MNRRSLLILGGLALVLGASNALVLGKERVLSQGRRVLLPLGPRDPRSLIQGDYMTLRYDLPPTSDGWPRDGLLRVTLDERDVGKVVGPLAPGEPPGEGAVALRYRMRDYSVRLGAEAFYFQEGTADQYNGARFGELRVAPSGESVLVGLRDADLKPLGYSARGGAAR